MGRAELFSLFLPICRSFSFLSLSTRFAYVAQAGLTLLILLPYPLSSEIMENATTLGPTFIVKISFNVHLFILYLLCVFTCVGMELFWYSCGGQRAT